MATHIQAQDLLNEEDRNNHKFHFLILTQPDKDNAKVAIPPLLRLPKIETKESGYSEDVLYFPVQDEMGEGDSVKQVTRGPEVGNFSNEYYSFI